MDKALNDDSLKLVRYKILFVKRDYEYAFPEQEALVWDNLDATAFTSWKIAEFIQSLGRAKTTSPWRNYPSEDKGLRKDGMLLGFPEDDKKYLRVYYEVLERYPREKFKHDEDEVKVLKEIRDAIAAERSGSPAGRRPAERPGDESPGWRLRR